MQRRTILRAAPATLVCGGGTALAQPAPPRPPSAAELRARAEAARNEVRARMEERRRRLEEVRDHLRSLLDNLPLLERARGFRELEYRNAGLTGLAGRAPNPRVIPAAVQTPSPGSAGPFLKVADPKPAAPAASSLRISQEAKDLIIEFEVSSAAIYTRQHQSPTWPGGNSGVTIGIGYDLGYCSAGAFAKDWGGILPEAPAGTLSPLCQLKADKAQAQVDQPVVKSVKVTWEQASAQFDRFLPLIVGETAAAFPNCDGLSPESLGALVSLVYNRGSDHSNTPRRVEMFNIANLMAAKTYAAVPAQIRAMKRLWQDVPGAEGLVERRELEAKLFEAGLVA